MREPLGRGAQYRSKMRAVGMLRTGFILVLLIIAYASTLPLQFLPAIPGYVPVYIRNGDEPLEDVNLALAEAFAEHTSSKNLEESNVILEIEQPVDYALLTNANDQESDKGVSDYNETADDKKADSEVEILHLDDAVTPMQRRETNRSNVKKKSEAVTLEVNRSRIPQLLTAQEHEDEQTPDSEDKTEKPNPISVSKEATIEVSNVEAKDKDDLEKLAAEVEKPDFKPNEVIDPNPNYPELPTEILGHHNSHDFGTHSENHQDVVPPTVSLQDEAHDESGSDKSLSGLGKSEESVEKDDSSNVSDNSGSNESK